MICHKYKFIFIHIPKTGGTSIEKFFNISPFDNKIPDYDNLVGYDRKLGIHLQHATVDEIKKNNLIPDTVWNSYFKFTIVRNPYDKMYSEYYWVSKDLGIKDTFSNFILKKGKYKTVLNNRKKWRYRGDHLIKQQDYILINGKSEMDYIGRFENFNETISYVLKEIGVKNDFNIHSKKMNKIFEHYSHFYTRFGKKQIERIYNNDLDYFNYEFEDKYLELDFFSRFKVQVKRLLKK